MALEAHPYADRYPMLSDERLRELAEDIKERGLLEPIVTYEGKTLDGRNRDRACDMAGVTQMYREYTGDSPAAFVRSKNLRRRDLTDDQRAGIAVASLDDIAADVERNRRRQQGKTQSGKTKRPVQVKPPGQSQNVTRATLAKEAGVSQEKIKQATAIRRHNPAALEEVKNGTVKLSDVLKPLAPAPAIPGATWGRQRSRRPSNGLAERVKQTVSRYPTKAEMRTLTEEIQAGHLDLSVDVLDFLVRHLSEARGGREMLSRALKGAFQDTENDTP